MNALKIATLSSLVALTACGVGAGEEQEQLETLNETDSSLTVGGRFQTFVGRDGQHYFHLVAANGEKVLASEGYATMAAAQAGIDSVQAHGQTESRYFVREASNGQFYFVLIAVNGNIIGVSEMYVTRYNAERAITTVAAIVRNAVAEETAQVNDPRFVFFKGLNGKYYFNLRAQNGEIVLQSQAYVSSAGAQNGAASVKTNGVIATRYTVLPAADGKHYFTLKAANGQVIGVGETYASRSGAEQGVQGVIELLASGAAQ